jgi:hypothetical protein
MYLQRNPRSWRVRSSMLRLLLAVSMLTFPAPGSLLRAAGQMAGASSGEIDFNIPAQPLGAALVAFGSAAGIDFYYNAALAEGRHSTAVVGRLTPISALQEMLRGTGLAPRMQTPGTVILVPATREAAGAKGAVVASAAHFEPYFATIQARVSEVLCRRASAGEEGNEAFLRVWLAVSGVIEQVEVIGASADETSSRALTSAVQGLTVGAPPPDMPQPVTLVVFPPSAARQDCRSSDAFQRAR